MLEGRASWTARWVATQRANLHDTRPARGDADAEQRLYRDLAIPGLGFSLAKPAGMETRTKFFDEQLLRAIDGGIAQVVVVGAGYDGRALRFSDAPVRWIEVDHPATQSDKIRRLERVDAPRGHISFAAVDIIDGDLAAALAKASQDAAEPTLWICEGLFPYLPPPSVAALLATLRGLSEPRSILVCNVLVRDTPSLSNRLIRSGVDRLLAAIGERRLGEFGPGEIEGFLDRAGWQVNIRQSTPASRADGSYMLAVAASPK